MIASPIAASAAATRATQLMETRAARLMEAEARAVYSGGAKACAEAEARYAAAEALQPVKRCLFKSNLVVSRLMRRPRPQRRHRRLRSVSLCRQRHPHGR